MVKLSLYVDVWLLKKHCSDKVLFAHILCPWSFFIFSAELVAIGFRSTVLGIRILSIPRNMRSIPGDTISMLSFPYCLQFGIFTMRWIHHQNGCTEKVSICIGDYCTDHCHCITINIQRIRTISNICFVWHWVLDGFKGVAVPICCHHHSLFDCALDCDRNCSL